MTTAPFETVVEDHASTILRVCRAVLGAGPDADDAWSETFLAALRAWPELDPDTNMEAWLVRVAHRKAIDITRHRARRALPVEEIDETALATSRPPAPADSSSEIWDEVAALPQRQRLAIAYHYLGGLPHAETAELTGSTPAAVRRAAADGIKALRRNHRPPTSPELSTKGAHR